MRRLLFTLILPSVALSQQSQKRGMTLEDYFSFEFASDPRVSPDGSQVVYVASRVDRAANRRVPSVWITSTDGTGSPKILLDESWSPGSPRWLPDGRSVSFISSRAPEDTGATAARRTSSARAQLWAYTIGSVAPRRVTSVKNGVSNCSWSPDGARCTSAPV